MSPGQKYIYHSSNMLNEIFSYLSGGEIIHKARLVSKRVFTILQVTEPFAVVRHVKVKEVKVFNQEYKNLLLSFRRFTKHVNFV